MARKRKIPTRKHHGIRDPLKQLELREKKLRNVVNNPPDRDNDQKASFKFEQFKKLAENAKAGKKMKRIHSGREDKPKTTAAKSKADAGGSRKQNIKRFIDETDKDYLKRVNRITTESLREAQYEAKYGVNVLRDPKTGNITIQKRPKNEIDELLKQKQKEKRGGRVRKNGKKTTPIKSKMDPKTAKELIKRAIKEDNEEKIKEKVEHEEYKQDVIKFGEVVHAPPSLSTLPRKAERVETVRRPGQKNNLILKSMLGQEDENAPTKTPTITKKVKKSNSSFVTKAQLKGKRKDLPAATRSMLETEQSKIIELYRNLKKSKIQQT